jgi:hypothetical protein
LISFTNFKASVLNSNLCPGFSFKIWLSSHKTIFVQFGTIIYDKLNYHEAGIHIEKTLLRICDYTLHGTAIPLSKCNTLIGCQMVFFLSI